MPIRTLNDLLWSYIFRLFEGPTLNMPAKYAAMIKAILLTTFYAPALPIAMVFTIAGFCLSYWADKVCQLNKTFNKISSTFYSKEMHYPPPLEMIWRTP